MFKTTQMETSISKILNRIKIMNLEKTKSNSYRLTLNTHELSIIVRVTIFTCKELEEELSTRTGYSKQEFDRLISKINETGGETIELTYDEYCMLSNIFNELCNGIPIDNFELAIGVSEQKVNELFDRFKQFN
jgi:predicted lactoylglutathione lyase